MPPESDPFQEVLDKARGAGGDPFQAVLDKAKAQAPVRPSDMRAQGGAQSASTKSSNWRTEIDNAAESALRVVLPMSATAIGPSRATVVGVAKSLAGPVQAAADWMGDKKLAGEVTAKIQAFQNAMEGDKPSKLAKAQESVGEVLPLVLGGEALELPKVATGIVSGTAKYLAGDAVGAATSYQEGKTPQERQKGRLVSGIIGAAGAPFVAAAKIASNVLTSTQNAKALKGLLDSLTESFEHATPKGEEVAKAVAPVAARAQKAFDNHVTATRQLVAKSGGIDVKPILEAAKDLPVKGMHPNAVIGREIMRGLEPHKEIPPNIGKAAQELLDKTKGAAKKSVKAKLEREGFRVEPEPGKPGDLYDLKQMSDRIGSHIAALPVKERTGSEVGKLKDVKLAIDKQLKTYLDSDWTVKRLYERGERQFKPLLEAMQEPSIRLLHSSSAEVRRSAILGLVHSGDSQAMERAAQVIGGKGSPARQDAYNVVLHDAWSKAIDRESGEVDAKKFAAYFHDPNVRATVQHLEDSSTEHYRKGVENLIDFSKLMREKSGHHFLQRMSDRSAWLSLAFGMENSVRALGHGEPTKAAGEFASAVVASFLVHKTGQFLDKVLSNRYGKNFLMAASKVAPETPEFAKLFDGFARRMQASGAPAASAAKPQGRSAPQQPSMLEGAPSP